MKGLAVALVAVALVATACGGSSNSSNSADSADSADSTPAASPTIATTPSTFPLKGQLTIGPTNTLRLGSVTMGDCAGSGGLIDLHDGTPVVVQDEAGTILATTVTASEYERLGPKFGQCHLTFSVDVPGGQKFYQVSIGGRDPYVATLDEALAGLILNIG